MVDNLIRRHEEKLKLNICKMIYYVCQFSLSPIKFFSSILNSTSNLLSILKKKQHINNEKKKKDESIPLIVSDLLCLLFELFQLLAYCEVAMISNINTLFTNKN